MTPEELKRIDDETLRKAELAALKPISYEEMEKVFNKWLLIPDEGILKFLTAFIFAHRISQSAIWAMIIGPSGGGKTEFLNAFKELGDIVPVSTVTPNTFLSGMPGSGDASLLPHLTNKIMLQKDWTSFLSMQKDALAEIYSQLREIYDGAYTKIFGNGKKRAWNGKMSLLCASTQAVDITQQRYTHLGERFINYRIVMPDRKEVAYKSLHNNLCKEQMGKELQNAVVAFFKSFDGVDISSIIPELGPDLERELVDLSDFSTRARSGVIRDTGMKKEVIFVPSQEMPTRFTQQLASLARGLMIINKGPLTELDKRILYKTALDSIPQTNKMVINIMAKGDEQTTSEIAADLGYPTETIRTYLENQAMLGICTRFGKKGTPDKWTLKGEFSSIIRHYEKVDLLTEEDIMARKEEEQGEKDPFFPEDYYQGGESS